MPSRGARRYWLSSCKVPFRKHLLMIYMLYRERMINPHILYEKNMVFDKKIDSKKMGVSELTKGSKIPERTVYYVLKKMKSYGYVKMIRIKTNRSISGPNNVYCLTKKGRKYAVYLWEHPEKYNINKIVKCYYKDLLLRL